MPSLFSFLNTIRNGMLFSYRKPLNFRESSEGSYRLGYAYSNDLETWYREDEKVGINTSEKGWDSQMVTYPQVSEIDGKKYLFYCGNEFGKYGFGLAKLKI